MIFFVSRKSRRAISSTRFLGSIIAVNRLPLRSKIMIPSSSSSNLICLDTPGWEVYKTSAASFAVSDCALATGELGGVFALCADGTRPLSLPVYVFPIGIVYNVAGVAELNLTARVIAMIFTGRITRWNDPAIAGLNPGIALPELAITPVHRSDNSGTTENFTQTLAQAAPEVWTSEPSGDWPADLGGEGGDKTVIVTLIELTASAGLLGLDAEGEAWVPTRPAADYQFPSTNTHSFCEILPLAFA